MGDFAGAGVSAVGVGPGEEGQDGAGRSGVVAEVEVVGAGVVEVDGALDEAEAENLGVEIEVALGVGGDGGDVVKTDDGFEHDGVAPFRDAVLLLHHKIRYRNKRFRLAGSSIAERANSFAWNKNGLGTSGEKALTMTE